jgi:hypothetical protein
MTAICRIVCRTQTRIYGINVALLRSGSRSRSRDVGTLPSARLDWRIGWRLTYTAIYCEDEP